MTRTGAVTSPRSRTFFRNLFSNTVGSTSAVGLGLIDGSEGDDDTRHYSINAKIIFNVTEALNLI